MKLLVLVVVCENCNFSNNSIRAKFFFNPQTPESPELDTNKDNNIL